MRCGIKMAARIRNRRLTCPAVPMSPSEPVNVVWAVRTPPPSATESPDASRSSEKKEKPQKLCVRPYPLVVCPATIPLHAVGALAVAPFRNTHREHIADPAPADRSVSF